jgi:hypothetical protein
MAPSLTIGQVAKTSGIAAKTIRYYEQIGVLPAPSRAASGYSPAWSGCGSSVEPAPLPRALTPSSFQGNDRAR